MAYTRTCIVLLLGVVIRSESITKLDLSYHHRVKSSTLADAVRNALQSNEDLDIDLTNSLLDKSIKEVASALQDTNSTSLIHLNVMRNGLSPAQARLLIKGIVDKNETSSPPSLPASSTASTAGEVSAHDNTEAEPTDSNATSLELDQPDETQPFVSRAKIATLNLGWNYFNDESRSKMFSKVIAQLIEDREACPETIRLDICGLGPPTCRSIAKGIIRRYEKTDSEEVKPISLHLSENPNIGDPGVAALAAAIKTARSSGAHGVIFDHLNLSGCGIGDEGAKALAIALEETGCCVNTLDLSNNNIGNSGMASLCDALCADTNTVRLQRLDVSNNVEMGDAVASDIGRLIEAGIIPTLVLRSCNFRADGAAAIGKSLRHFALSKSLLTKLDIDLSGNPFGVLRKKSKGSSKYSATALKSKASETTMAYMNLVAKTVKKGLQDFGVSTVESDDEAEGEEEEEDDGSDPSKAKCGALSFAGAFLDAEISGDDSDGVRKEVHIGLRRCFFDTKAADALAAIIVEAGHDLDLTVKIDATMNDVLEDSTVRSLSGDSDLNELLEEMAERYMAAMEIIQEAKRRSQEAALAAASRRRQAEHDESMWGEPGHANQYDEEPRWDSDADYEEEDGYDNDY